MAHAQVRKSNAQAADATHIELHNAASGGVASGQRFKNRSSNAMTHGKGAGALVRFLSALCNVCVELFVCFVLRLGFKTGFTSYSSVFLYKRSSSVSTCSHAALDQAACLLLHLSMIVVRGAFYSVVTHAPDVSIVRPSAVRCSA